MNSSIETKTLEWLKLGIQQALAQGIHLTQLERVQDLLVSEFVYRINARVLAEQLPPRHYVVTESATFTAPASTWQMFKQSHEGSWWLDWLVRRHPVRTKETRKSVQLTVDIQDYLTYPWQTRVTPGMGDAVRIPLFTQHLDWRD